MKLLILCETDLDTIVVDRRVLNQTDMFLKEGWNITLTLPDRTKHAEENWPDLLHQLNVHPFAPKSMTELLDDLVRILDLEFGINVSKFQPKTFPKIPTLLQGYFEETANLKIPPVLIPAIKTSWKNR